MERFSGDVSWEGIVEINDGAWSEIIENAYQEIDFDPQEQQTNPYTSVPEQINKSKQFPKHKKSADQKGNNITNKKLTWKPSLEPNPLAPKQLIPTETTVHTKTNPLHRKQPTLEHNPHPITNKNLQSITITPICLYLANSSFNKWMFIFT